MAGRPTTYKEEYNKLAYGFCLLGATDKFLADRFEVCKDTINEWKKVYPEFSASIKSGKEIADAKVAEALFNRACGYSHPEEKIFNDGGEILRADTIKHYPPDTAAAFIWLKNRGGWKDKQEVNSTNVNLNSELTDNERKEALDKIKKGLDDFDDYE